MNGSVGREPQGPVGRLDDVPFPRRRRRPLGNGPFSPLAVLIDSGPLQDAGLGIDEPSPDSPRPRSKIDDLAIELRRIVPRLSVDDSAGGAETPHPYIVGPRVDAGCIVWKRIGPAEKFDVHEPAAIAGEETVGADKPGISLAVEDDVLERPGASRIDRPINGEGWAATFSRRACCHSLAADEPERAGSIESHAQEVADLPSDRVGDGGSQHIEGLPVEPREARPSGAPHAVIRCQVDGSQRRLGEAVLHRPPADGE